MRKGGYVEAFVKKTMNNPEGFLNFTGGAMSICSSGQNLSAGAYIINVKNTTSSDIQNFVLFNANNALFVGGSFNNNMYSINGVNIPSGYGIDNYYLALLSQSQTQPFTVGTTVMTAITRNSQVQKPMSVIKTDASGLSNSTPVTLLKDPCQSQVGMIVCNTPYAIDGTTALTISTVVANAEFSMYFFPTQNVNPVNTLDSQQSIATYQKPDIISAM